MTSTFNSIIENTKESLSFLKEIGCHNLECSEKSLKIMEEWNFKKLKSQIALCNKCNIAQNRKNIIFGEGSYNAKLIFIGDIPKTDEEKTEKPLAGEAGILLNKIISAMNLSLEQVYICNLLKCKIDKNIKNCEKEIKNCLPFLKDQIKKINPQIICTLGTMASQTILNNKSGITGLRGKFHKYNNIKVMPTFHPAELIENENKKRYVWEDMKKIMAEIS